MNHRLPSHAPTGTDLSCGSWQTEALTFNYPAL